jgi:hypothetical protein
MPPNYLMTLNGNKLGTRKEPGKRAKMIFQNMGKLGKWFQKENVINLAVAPKENDH